MALTYVKIASTTVGAGGAATIVFSSIPQTYTDLMIYASTRSTTSDTSMSLYPNGSTSNGSSRTLLTFCQSPFPNGASTVESTIVNWSTVGSPAVANLFGNTSWYIPNYTGSTNKSVSADGVTEGNSTFGVLMFTAGLWSNTAAITSITLDLDGIGTFAQNSTATLYGILKA